MELQLSAECLAVRGLVLCFEGIGYTLIVCISVCACVLVGGSSWVTQVAHGSLSDFSAFCSTDVVAIVKTQHSESDPSPPILPGGYLGWPTCFMKD